MAAATGISRQGYLKNADLLQKAFIQHAEIANENENVLEKNIQVVSGMIGKIALVLEIREEEVIKRFCWGFPEETSSSLPKLSKIIRETRTACLRMLQSIDNMCSVALKEIHSPCFEKALEACGPINPNFPIVRDAVAIRALTLQGRVRLIAGLLFNSPL